MKPPRTGREVLLAVAVREGWDILHDLGLHLELQRGTQRFSLQFDVEGRCTWCEGDWPHQRPLDSALQVLVRSG